MSMLDYYVQHGYQTGDGGLFFYYVALRTHNQTAKKEVCLCGQVSWSRDEYNPNVTMSKIKPQSGYKYTRLGPFPRRVEAEQKAIEFAEKYHNDPTQYGIWSVVGPPDIPDGTYRAPLFF